MRPAHAAFTLVELMVVVAIIGVLATVVTVSVVGESDKTKVVRVTADMQSIETAVGMFRIHNGRLPRTLDELWVRPTNAPKWGPDPYLNKRPPKDPWGNPYLFERRGREIELVSYGSDGAIGGEDTAADLSSITLQHES